VQSTNDEHFLHLFSTKDRIRMFSLQIPTCRPTKLSALHLNQLQYFSSSSTLPNLIRPADSSCRSHLNTVPVSSLLSQTPSDYVPYCVWQTKFHTQTIFFPSLKHRISHSECSTALSCLRDFWPKSRLETIFSRSLRFSSVAGW